MRHFEILHFQMIIKVTVTSGLRNRYLFKTHERKTKHDCWTKQHIDVQKWNLLKLWAHAKNHHLITAAQWRRQKLWRGISWCFLPALSSSYIAKKALTHILSHSLSELEKFREITVCHHRLQCCLRHFDEFFASISKYKHLTVSIVKIFCDVVLVKVWKWPK